MQGANQISVEQIIVTTALGRQVDFSMIFEELLFQENFFSPYISGSLSVVDSSDHYETLPLIGQELLTVRFVSLDEVYSYTFYVYKISKIQKPDPRTSQYTMYFVSREQMQNNNVRVRRSFKDTKYSNMIESVLKNDLGTKKEIAIDPTLNEFTYVPPNIHPFSVIKRMTKHCVSEQTQQSNYAFFEDRRGFICGPISSFATTRPKFSYKLNENVDPQNPNTPVRLMDPLSIMKFSVKKQTDTLDMLNRGIFASTLFGIDMLTRNIKEKTFTYFEEFEKREHLNEHPLFVDTGQFNAGGNQFFTYTNEDALDNDYISERDAQMKIELSSETSLRRRLQIQSYDNNVFTIVIPGNPVLFVGDVIDVDIRISINGEERRHRTLSGNTMITQITHSITRSGKYLQSLETVKDSNISQIGESP